MAAMALYFTEVSPLPRLYPPQAPLQELHSPELATLMWSHVELLPYEIPTWLKFVYIKYTETVIKPT